MKPFIPEAVKLFIFTTILFAVVSFVTNNHYGDMLDIVTPREYNCSQVEQQLIGGWHPDIPKEVIEQCRKLKEEKYHVKTT
jgi:hypothetical protein